MKETKKYYTSNRVTYDYTDHTTFGGLIYKSDFDGYCSMSDIADRIISDWCFDKQCKQNAETRERNKVYKSEKINRLDKSDAL